MKRIYLTTAITVVALLVLASVAMAFTWSNVGRDPLVPGGVWSKVGFVKAMKNSLVRHRFEQVRAGNHQPKWVLAQAFALAEKASNVREGKIIFGENVGTMGSGHSVDYNVFYRGQYNPLKTFYVQPKKTTTVRINGIYYLKTVSYQVTLAMPCGNALIIHKKIVKKRLYELRVEKRLKTTNGERLAGWQIVTDVAGKVKNLTTKATCSVLVGRFLAGTKYNALEIQQEGWEVVSPFEGTFTGKMPRRNLTLKFVNKRTTEKLSKLYVEKRLDTFDGPWLADWHIIGTIGGTPVDIPTSAEGPVLVGEYPVGTGFNLCEVQQEGWELVSPEGGLFEGTMPEQDVTLTWVNTQITPPPSYAAFGTKGYWHNQNGLAEITEEDIAYVNTLVPYSANPFSGKAEISAYLVADNAGGDPKIQLGQQLLAFIFNVRHRLGGPDVLMQLPDGSWATGGSIIQSAVSAWQTGGDEARAWASVLDTCNNLEGNGPGTGVPYQP